MTVTPADGTPTTSLVFGVVFDFNGTQVPISTNDVKDAIDNGITFGLPGPVDLGTPDDFVTWFQNQFGVQIPPATSLPKPLDGIIAKLGQVDVTVTQLYVSIPGTKSPAGSTTQYAVGLSAMWPAGQGISIIDKVLEVEGAVFGATNMPPKPPTPPAS